MEFSINVPDLKSLIDTINEMGGNVDKLVDTAINASIIHVQSLARSKAPHRTGTLQRSILPEFSSLHAELKVNEKYGLFFEQGTGIYGPKGKRFKGQIPFLIEGKDTGWRWINGIKPRPFFQPAIEESEPFIKEQFEKVFDIISKAIQERNSTDVG